MPAGVSAYVPLANVTLSSSAASVTFSSISQAYRDLVLVVTGNVASGQQACSIVLNNDTTAAYSYVRAGGSGSAVNSNAASNGNAMFLGQGNAYLDAASSGWNCLVNFQDYSVSDKHKSMLTRENQPALGTDMYAHRWANTASITSMQVKLSASTWVAGSTFALYGVK